MAERNNVNQTYKLNPPIILEKPFRLEISRTTKGPTYSLKVSEDRLEDTVRKALMAAAIIEEALRDWPKPLSEIHKILASLEEAGKVSAAEKATAEEGKPAEILTYEGIEELPWRKTENPDYVWLYLDEAKANPVGLKILEEVNKASKGVFEFGKYVFRVSGNGRFLGRLKNPKYKLPEGG